MNREIDDLRHKALLLSQGRSPTATEIERVAKLSSADASRWAFGQWELRRRAKQKFTNADQMLFVREALEQATHERVADYHASLFPASILVADLTAGIGADLIALAKRGPVLGFELDPARAGYCRFNGLLSGFDLDVRVEDSLEWLRSSPTINYAFADPARRVDGKRTRELSEFSPDPARLAGYFSRIKRGVIKLSPMLNDDLLADLGSQIEFVSFGDECREALVFCGEETEAGVSAVHLESGNRLASSSPPSPVETPLGFLFDADPAAVRSHSLGTLCRRHTIVPLGDSNGYLTGSDNVLSPWFKTYRILYHGKADLRTTRKALQEISASTPEMKQRGVKLDLIKERQNFSMDGSRTVSLAIWPVGKSLRHTIMERIYRE